MRVCGVDCFTQRNLSQPEPIRLIVFPSHTPNSPPAIVPLDPGRALSLLLANTVNLSRFPEAAIDTLGEVVEGASSFSLQSGSVQEAVDAIQEVSSSCLAWR